MSSFTFCHRPRLLRTRPPSKRALRLCCAWNSGPSTSQRPAGFDVATHILRRCGLSACALSLALSVASLAPLLPTPSAFAGPTPDSPVFDGAGLVAAEKEKELTVQLQDFEKETGWRLRVYTSYGPDTPPTDKVLRRVWGLDKRTVVVAFNPSNPSLTNFYWLGDDVLVKLRRPFWQELQARYGNLYYIREQGEQAAVLNTMDAITACLGREGGCRVVPGLPEDMYAFTLVTSIAGGLVFGFCSLIPPQGVVQRQWVWLLVFSPLWGILFVSFGLGPVVSRTADLAPVLSNTAAFLLTGASFRLVPWLREQLTAPPSSS